MTYANCITLNNALYFDLFDDIPYRQVKQFFEEDIDRDEYDFEVEIENLPCDRIAFAKVKFTFSLFVDINEGSLPIIRPKTFTKILEYNTSSGIALKLLYLQDDEENCGDEDEEESEEDCECNDCGWRSEYPQSHILYCGGNGCVHIRSKYRTWFDEDGELKWESI